MMSKLKLFIFLILILFFSGGEIFSQENSPLYAVAISYTPVLNTSDYEMVFGGADGEQVKLDNQGLIREMEFIAFPNTVFEIIESFPKEDHSILKVTTSDYPYESSDLFIDSRFVEVVSTKPTDRAKVMPDKNEILKNILNLEGSTYMWGGNYDAGIEALLDYYSPVIEIDNNVKINWCLKGVDCSGLIYQATGGATPRNTSSLVKYGTGLDISDKSASEIAGMLLPLDLIVWSGHVIIVVDENTVIESSPPEGVHKSELMSRLKQVISERTPVNEWASTSGKRFVVRRWAD
ncbi:MAG: peptidoglycan endopeptidase [Ignavibacteria bacterium]